MDKIGMVVCNKCKGKGMISESIKASTHIIGPIYLRGGDLHKVQCPRCKGKGEVPNIGLQEGDPNGQ